jgi:hypothetical protein
MSGTRAHRKGPPVVFVGPTLAREEAEEIVAAVYLPPASQGAVVEAVQRHDPRVLVIIDGTFQLEPAVRHKEILWALHRGIPVVGAGSMGALRAAELFPHMRGVGLVYRWYRRFPFTSDDAVAVLHGPLEMSSKPLTTALLDLRMTFRVAERRGLIARALRSRLEAAAIRLNFCERSIEAVVTAACGTADLGDLSGLLASALVEQKKLDAIAALRLLRDGALEAPPEQIPFARTTAFLRDLLVSAVRLD